MQIRDVEPALRELTVTVFERSFTDAAGPQEGQAIASLVRELIDSTPVDDRQGHVMFVDEEPVAGVFFSRLEVAADIRTVLLSPMAVITSRQRQGIGQQLIRQSLDRLREQGESLVLTYGDPAFYGKLGFEPVSVEQIPAPYALSQPMGWQALSLNAEPIPHLTGPTQCVPAFRQPALW